MNQTQRRWLWDYRERLERNLKLATEQDDVEARQRANLQLSTFEAIERGLGESPRPDGKGAGPVGPPSQFWRLRVEIEDPRGTSLVEERLVTDVELRANLYAAGLRLGGMVEGLCVALRKKLLAESGKSG